jgi:hypothetical protein
MPEAGSVLLFMLAALTRNWACSDAPPTFSNCRGEIK